MKYNKTLMGIAVATFFISSCAKDNKTDDRNQSSVINDRNQSSATDDQIQSSARDSYVFTTYLKNDNINVDSKDGVVTLTGTVSDESHKSLAKETVENLPSVKRVDNRLQVTGEQHAERSDAWLTTKVKTNLMFHKNVSALNTDVTTNNGIVTLKGEAGSVEERNLATEYAKDVVGVKGVRNEMTLAKSDNKSTKPFVNSRAKPTKGEDIDDASVTGQIKVALFSHRSTSALNTNVKTKDGVVTLEGVAKNEAEKKLVTKLSYDVYGVKNVKNNMTIK